VVALEGRVDIAEAAKLKSALLEAVAAPQGMRVEVSQATAVDVTAVQLLWAAQRQARQMGKRFEIAGPWSEEAEGQLREMGLYPSQLFAPLEEERNANRGVE
jgi:anti-anti-sigma regulatory factor